MTRSVLIIGSGPSGLTAAVYAARADLKPLVFEGFKIGGQPGGQLMTTTEVENFPGFSRGIMGPDLITAMREQAVRFGAEMVTEDVISIDLSSRPFKVASSTHQEQSQAIILATGASARVLDLPSVKKFWGKGVSACATCDGALPIFRNKVIAVFGGGDSAIEESLFLTRFAAKVLLVHRRNEFRASRIMQERALNHPNIEILFDAVLEEVYGTTFADGVKLRNVKTGAITSHECKGVFMAIGHVPNTAFLNSQLELDDKGYIRVRHPSCRTSVEGVFACGDVTDPHYRQAISAAGTGCIAALDAERWLAGMSLG